MHTISRRHLLAATAVAAGGLVSFDRLFGFSQLAAQDAGDDAQTILNLAATAEAFACTHYYTVLTESEVALSPDEIDILKGFLDAELYHLQYLAANGAVPVVNEFYFPNEIYNDREQFGDVTELVETTFIAAYLAATRRLAELGASLLAATAAQVAAIEQEHLSIVRSIGGRRPNNIAFARPLFFNVSEAVPALQPFLVGGENYTGPVAYPGDEAIRDFIKDAGVLNVPIFSDPAAFPNATAAASVVCTVTPTGAYNCNLRSGAGLSFEVVGSLKQGATLDVDAQSTDNDGFTWYRSGAGWVRADIVSVVGECGTLPSV